MGRASSRKWLRRRRDPRWIKHCADCSEGGVLMGRRVPLPPRPKQEARPVKPHRSGDGALAIFHRGRR